MSFVKSLFGGKSRAEKQLEQFRPVNLRSSGLSTDFNRTTNTLSLDRSGAVDASLSNLVQGLRNRSTEFRNLREDVRPGFGRLTQSRVDAIRTAGSRTVGNLRQELGRRRILGSSFAEREIAGTEATFAQEEERARAEAGVQEIALTGELIQREFAGAIQAAQSIINQFNFESSVGASLATNTTNALNANLTAQAQAASAAEGGAGDFLGTVVGAFAEPIGKFFKKIF